MERLIKRARQKEVTLFIGSGFSYNAGAPSANILVRHLIEDGELDYQEPYDDLALTDVSSCFVDVNGRYELMKLLEKYYKTPSKNTADHDLLASIPHFKAIYTTNYDTFIEDAYPVDKRDVITSSHGCVYSDKNKVRIYKLHGDVSTLNDPDSIVITKEDYDNYFKRKSITVMWEDLVNAFRHTYVIFIGYSLYDYNIMSLVDKVRNEIGNNFKGMYLIAPNIAVGREEQLKKKGIIYIQATGDKFLSLLKKSVNDNIAKDFNEKCLEDNMVVPQYFHSKGLDPILRYGEHRNYIEGVKGYNGLPVDMRMTLTISKETKAQIDQRIYNASMNVGDTKLDIPVYEIPLSSIVNAEVRANDILLKDKSDLTKILILPRNELIDVKIRIPSRGFAEETKVLIYDKAENAVGIKFDIKIGKIEVTMHFMDNMPTGNVEITTELYEQYNSSNEAIQWVEVPIALFSGEYVNFKIFSIKEGKVYNDALKPYIRAKRYYDSIKTLESVYDVEFTEHGNYSDDGLMCAVILESYFSKRGTSYLLIRNLNCDIDTSTGCKDARELIHNKKALFMALSYYDFKGILNGYEFNIPYVNVCLQHCYITKVKHVKGPQYSLVVHEEAENNLVFGSDYPISNEGSRLNLRGHKS